MRTLIFTIIFMCWLTTSGYSAEPVRIGVTLGLTGKYSRMSDMIQKGFSIWVEKVNNSGGLLGRKVEMIIYDDHSDAKEAKSLYENLIIKDKVDHLFGPYSSTITAAILPITEKYGYPLLLTGAASDKLWQMGYKYAFGLFVPASRYSVGFLEMLAMKGHKKTAIVFADDAFSTSIAEGAKEWGDKFGLENKLFEKFIKGTKDLSELAQRVKESDTDALIVCGHFDESVDMRKAMNKINWHSKIYFATVGPAMDAYRDQLGKDADFAFSSSTWEPLVLFQENDHNIFLKPFTEKFNIVPTYHAAQAFAAGQILETAVNKANSLDRKKIQNLLSTMDAMSIIGRYKVDKTGMQIRHFQVTIQRQKGKQEIVWPDSLATASPIFQEPMPSRHSN